METLHSSEIRLGKNLLWAGLSLIVSGCGTPAEPVTTVPRVHGALDLCSKAQDYSMIRIVDGDPSLLVGTPQGGREYIGFANGEIAGRLTLRVRDGQPYYPPELTLHGEMVADADFFLGPIDARFEGVSLNCLGRWCSGDYQAIGGEWVHLMEIQKEGVGWLSLYGQSKNGELETELRTSTECGHIVVAM